MMLRRRRAGLGLSALLVLLATAGAPATFGATTSWEFDRSSYHFGSVILGSGPTEPRGFVLTNTGESTLVTNGWRLSWRGFAPLDPGLFQVTSNSCGARSLEPQESCSIAVSFDPVYPGPKEGTLRIPAKNGELPSASVELAGVGSGPWVSMQPDHLIFEPVQVGKAPPAQSITVENQGNLGLMIGAMSFTDLLGVTQSPSPFQVVGGTCRKSQVVRPGGNCTIEVALTPTESGFFQSRLAISDNASDSPQSIEVQGTGTAPLPPSRTGGGPGASKPPDKPPPPAVRITRHPSRITSKRAAAFWFSAAPVDASAECELDLRGFEPCSAPSRYKQLPSGRHEFQVRVHSPSDSSASATARFHWRIRRHVKIGGWNPINRFSFSRVRSASPGR